MPMTAITVIKLGFSPRDNIQLDKLRVHITVSRQQMIRAGQYIIVSIPKLGVLTGSTRTPFMISWWNQSLKGSTISLLVESRTGFNRQLDRHINKELLAFLDRIYGIKNNFGNQRTILIFMTGICIAGYIPYIKNLINGYNNCQVRTRRILLVWQINKESKQVKEN